MLSVPLLFLLSVTYAAATSGAQARSLERCSDGVLCEIVFADDDQGRPGAEAVLGFALTDYLPPNTFTCVLNRTQIRLLHTVPSVRAVLVVPRVSIAGGQRPPGSGPVKITALLGQNPTRNQTRFVQGLIADLNIDPDALQVVKDNRVVIQVGRDDADKVIGILADQCEVAYVEIGQPAGIIR